MDSIVSGIFTLLNCWLAANTFICVSHLFLIFVSRLRQRTNYSYLGPSKRYPCEFQLKMQQRKLSLSQCQMDCGSKSRAKQTGAWAEEIHENHNFHVHLDLFRRLRQRVYHSLESYFTVYVWYKCIIFDLYKYIYIYILYAAGYTFQPVGDWDDSATSHLTNATRRNNFSVFLQFVIKS